MDNMIEAPADHNKVTQLLDDCQATLAINEIVHEDQIIEDLYVDHLQGFKERL